MTDKFCTGCSKTKERSEFNTNVRRYDGLQTQCRECRADYNKRHYVKQKNKYVSRAKLSNKAYVDEWRKFKATLSCTKCGENHIACLDFHHTDRNTKEYDIGHLIALHKSLDVVYEEVKKCIVLCSNCHRKLHWNERNGMGE